MRATLERFKTPRFGTTFKKNGLDRTTGTIADQ
jgi:hypothetical protein